MYKTTAQHLRYWQSRQINWKAAYFDSWNHPHRFLIKGILQRIQFNHLLEIGCAAGANLYLIQNSFPHAQTGGVDVNPGAIATARQLLHPATILDVADGDNLFFSDKSADVVLTDMVLIYCNLAKARRVLKEIKRVGNRWIILVEFHNQSFWPRWTLKLSTGYYAYNYERLLNEAGFYDIEMFKIPEAAWPGGEPQKTFGYVIMGKIP